MLGAVCCWLCGAACFVSGLSWASFYTISFLTFWALMLFIRLISDHSSPSQRNALGVGEGQILILLAKWECRARTSVTSRYMGPELQFFSLHFFCAFLFKSLEILKASSFSKALNIFKGWAVWFLQPSWELHYSGIKLRVLLKMFHNVGKHPSVISGLYHWE